MMIPRIFLRLRNYFYFWEYLYYRFFYSKPRLKIGSQFRIYLIAGGENLNRIIESYYALFPDEVQNKIAEADSICEHIFDLLGSRPKKLSQHGEYYQPIDWQNDFKSSYRWNPKTFFRNIRYGNKEGVDIKLPWELSRFQHLNLLGQAYILTKDKKYADEFANQISDWIEKNPVGFGVNWRCTMDVAIRAANWLVAQEYFSDEDFFTKEFWQIFYLSIYEHGKFIKRHLENHSHNTNNHYVSDLVGLFFIAIYCTFFKESKKWQNFAVKELSREIEKQIYSDGCNFEASTSYHRLTLELFFYAELLAQRAGIKFSNHYKEKVRKMFEFSLYCIKPNGFAPQIGDNDSGRFLVFKKRPILEHKYLLSLAICYYENSELKFKGNDLDEEAFWVFGSKGEKKLEHINFEEKPLGIKEFPEAGWYIMRQNDDYCFISCGPNGQNGNGGHAHNDKLSFELMLGGQDIIVDPGTYVYTPFPVERNEFRSTESHNTIKFDGFEQNEIQQRNLFSLPDRVKIIATEIKKANGKFLFRGNIQYEDFIHQRIITLDSESGICEIQDKLSSLKPLKGNIFFHLSPDLESDGNIIINRETQKKIASIEIPKSNIIKREYDYSPEYGQKVKAECLIANISTSKKVCYIKTLIRKI